MKFSEKSMAIFFFIFPEGLYEITILPINFKEFVKNVIKNQLQKPGSNENYTTADITTLTQRAPPWIRHQGLINEADR